MTNAINSSGVRKIVGPFNRVEGDLEIALTIDEGRVAKAEVNSPLFRGFERILIGKDPLDALVYTPRICGICSVAQSVAAATAIADAQELEVAPNGRLSSNIILAAENLADHLSHFYLFFMPDFARPCYSEYSWHTDVVARFKAQQGRGAIAMLQARAKFLHITGILAGKWPHSLALQPGGTTRSVETQERIKLMAILGDMRQFLESQLFGDTLENIAQLTDVDALDAWASAHAGSDFALFLKISEGLELVKLGVIPARFLSYGAYQQESGALFKRGVWSGELTDFDQSDIAEDLTHSWLTAETGPAHPFQGTTQPSASEDGGYSWCKAPRLNGQTMEVGAIARQSVDGHPLIRHLVSVQRSNVHTRVVARLLELALVVPKMEAWVRALEPKAPFCNHGQMPRKNQGVGLIEAARGSLGHWLSIEDGVISNYQIIAPTTWNFSPRDTQNAPGPLELALHGLEVSAAEVATNVAVQHIVRSFDPCMVCTVH